MKKTATGLEYIVLGSGAGERRAAESHQHSWSSSTTGAISTRPKAHAVRLFLRAEGDGDLPSRRDVIPGFSEALTLMRPGDSFG